MENNLANYSFFKKGCFFAILYVTLPKIKKAELAIFRNKLYIFLQFCRRTWSQDVDTLCANYHAPHLSKSTQLNAFKKFAQFCLKFWNSVTSPLTQMHKLLNSIRSRTKFYFITCHDPDYADCNPSVHPTISSNPHPPTTRTGWSELTY